MANGIHDPGEIFNPPVHHSPASALAHGEFCVSRMRTVAKLQVWMQTGAASHDIAQEIDSTITVLRYLRPAEGCGHG